MTDLPARRSPEELFSILEGEMQSDAVAQRKRAEELFISSIEQAVLTICDLMRLPNKPEMRFKAAAYIVDRGLGRMATGEGRKLHQDSEMFGWVKGVSEVGQ